MTDVVAESWDVGKINFYLVMGFFVLFDFLQSMAFDIEN